MSVAAAGEDDDLAKDSVKDDYEGLKYDQAQGCGSQMNGGFESTTNHPGHSQLMLIENIVGGFADESEEQGVASPLAGFAIGAGWTAGRLEPEPEPVPEVVSVVAPVLVLVVVATTDIPNKPAAHCNWSTVRFADTAFDSTDSCLEGPYNIAERNSAAARLVDGAGPG